MKPQIVSDLDVIFGTKALSVMPPYPDIPEAFKNNSNAWVGIANKWFFEGFDARPLIAKPGIDKTDAIRHLKSIMCSFEPKHEHKIAAVAYLMSEWLEEVTCTECGLIP